MVIQFKISFLGLKNKNIHLTLTSSTTPDFSGSESNDRVLHILQNYIRSSLVFHPGYSLRRGGLILSAEIQSAYFPPQPIGGKHLLFFILKSLSYSIWLEVYLHQRLQIILKINIASSPLKSDLISISMQIIKFCYYYRIDTQTNTWIWLQIIIYTGLVKDYELSFSWF